MVLKYIYQEGNDKCCESCSWRDMRTRRHRSDPSRAPLLMLHSTATWRGKGFSHTRTKQSSKLFTDFTR